MKKRQIINQIILMFIFSLPFLYFSCQEDIVYKQKNVNVQMELDYRTDPGNWCDGGQSDPPKFAIWQIINNGQNLDVYVLAFKNGEPLNINNWVGGLENDIKLYTTAYNFCTESGPTNQGNIYENPMPYAFEINGVEYFGIYLFKNIEPLGTHFAVEVLYVEEQDFDGCNVFPWKECE